MPGQGIRRNEEGLGFITTLLVLVIVFAIVIGVYVNFFVYRPPSSTGNPRFAEVKDTVRISYIGYFEDGSVFDTSISSVGNDNATWPKALSFSWRSSYSDFSFTIGKTNCTSQATDCAITGMSRAVTGLHEGDSVTHLITPGEGYGAKNRALVTTSPLVQTVPVTQTMNATAFRTKYGSAPQEGLPVVDPQWGWMTQVHVSGNIVTVKNSPQISKTYPLYVNQTKGGTWSATVESIDDGANNGTGAITILNQFVFTQGHKLMVSPSSTGGQFFVTDNQDGTFTVDENREVVGANLIFYMTVLQITKAS